MNVDDTVNFNEALKEAEAWLNFEGVEGIAEGEINGKPCISVFVSRKVKEIPDEQRGVRVVVEGSGEFDAFSGETPHNDTE